MAQRKHYQPHFVPDDINATPRTYISDVNISVTLGCPCDPCPDRETCRAGCPKFNYWVTKGPTQAQKQAARQVQYTHTKLKDPKQEITYDDETEI